MKTAVRFIDWRFKIWHDWWSIGNVIAVQEKRPRPRLSILEVVIADGTGPLKIVLFNQGYKKNFYKKGQHLYAYGKAEFQYGSMQMNTPQIENLGDGMEPDRGIVPNLCVG